jgi:hypothetical protein
MSIPLRSDFDASQLRALARKTKNAPQARWLLALAAIYEGASRTEAARIRGVILQIVRDWVVRFNAQGPDRLIPAVHGVVRSWLVDLIQWLWDVHRVPISKQTLSRGVSAPGYRKLSARPRHRVKSEVAVVAFKEISPRVWRRSRQLRPLACR